MTPRELEDRLIAFAVNIIRLSDGIKPSVGGKNLSEQIVRSSSSTALNYGEAQSAESPKDFVHKLGICLKEMRETFINLRIIDGAKLHEREPAGRPCRNHSHQVTLFRVTEVSFQVGFLLQF